ncbi:Na/Pi cotransporter family protein [Hominifimenecus sp. rT4P-3]|uniref:Na/Pi cotransporter family protein n=1 Tax=Hominifimenecus sp. rT4P-3 TaxID=3242979 RepID=UPI003DA312D1
MTVSDIGMLFQFVGGLGMFLYGMNTMAEGLQQSAGGKMKKWLEILTNNRLMGVIAGALITAVIQSSSATTVMVVGFVNAGLLSLNQAVGVIMGANIGTTVTSWLVSMSEWGSILKPEFFAPLLIGAGALMQMFSKKSGRKRVGEILLGFGILFVGLSFMSGAIEPYRNAPVFASAFALLGKNPILGILTGAAVTAVIQSSSASVGILQTLAKNGVVTWNSAIYITLGQNIGTCVTALLASAGGHKTAKRAAVIHLLFNVIGAVIFGAGSFLLLVLFPKWGIQPVNSVGISVFHTVFNVTNTLLLFPFAGKLVKLSEKLLPEEVGGENDPIQGVRQRLAEYRSDTPAFALEAATYEVAAMGNVCLKNVRTAMDALKNRDEDAVRQVLKREDEIDQLETLLTEYMVKLNHLPLNEAQSMQLRNLIYTINDLERMGDHAENLAELAQTRIQNDLEFSPMALEELSGMGACVTEAVECAISSRTHLRICDVKRVEELEKTVDAKEKKFRGEHIDRLACGDCQAHAGVIFLDAISNLERICDHAENIAGYVAAEQL